MKRYTMLFAMALLAVTMLFSVPRFASADELTLPTMTLMQITPATAPTDGDKPVVRGTWGGLKHRFDDRVTVPVPAVVAEKPTTGERVTVKGGAQSTSTSVTSSALGGAAYLAWPFNSLSPRSSWRGDEGDYSGGGRISACGSTSIWSHSLSDKYSRDLSNQIGTSAGVPIYASRTGIVIFSGWSGGYGNTVVIWVPGENIQIRYAHLQEIGTWQGYIMQGWYVGRVGNTPGGFGAHLHMTVYRNIPLTSGGSPQFTGNMCRGEQFACPFYFN